jgi:hypothetical protein
MAAYNGFKSMLKDANINPADFGLHSLRVGAATDAYIAGVPGNIIDLRGRWRSANMKNVIVGPLKRSG